MKIGILGGSFNPIHKGHTGIASYAIEHLNLDKLFFVPAFKSPFKSKVKYASADDRVNMIELVKPEKTEISHFEVNRKNISYTIDTVRYFKQKFPNDELYLMIGSDNVYKLNKWKNIDEISKMVNIVVFKREGNFSKINIKKYNCILMDNPLFDFSSTWFRKGYMKNVDLKVMDYIAQNYLYIPDLMLNMLDHKRLKHSQSVGSYAAKFAKAAGIDSKKAWATGCLHDITKCWTKEEHREYLISKGIDETKVKDHELHSLTGYYWIRDEYRLNDEEVINAVLYHTSLNDELSKMDKVIFAADKLCDGRKHQGIQKDRELILNNFDEGFKKIVNVVYGILLELKRPLTDKQKEIYKRWM